MKQFCFGGFSFYTERNFLKILKTRKKSDKRLIAELKVLPRYKSGADSTRMIMACFQKGLNLISLSWSKLCVTAMCAPLTFVGEKNHDVTAVCPSTDW